LNNKSVLWLILKTLSSCTPLFLTNYIFLLLLFITSLGYSQNFWQQTNGPYGGWIQVLAINSQGVLFAGTSQGNIFRSTNNGNNWVQTSFTDANINTIAINSDGKIFVSSKSGVFRSTDNGNTWTFNNSGLPVKEVLSFTFDINGIIFAGTGSGLYYSTDNGNNWNRKDCILNDTDIILLATKKNGYMFAGIFWGSLNRSTDNGNNWVPITIPYTFTTKMSFNSAGDIFAGTWGSGVYRSLDNGVNWTQCSNGITSNNIYSVATSPNGTIFVGISDGIFRSTDKGDNWTQISSPLFLAVPAHTLIINNLGYVFEGTTCTGINRSTDNGNNWVPHNTGLIANEVAAFCNNNNGDIIAGTYYSGISYYSAAGNNWIPINNGLTALTSNEVLSLINNGAGNLFAGTAGGGIFRSSDNGNNWTTASQGLIGYIIFSFVIDSKGYIFAGANDGVYLSTDEGGNWIRRNNGLPSSAGVSALAINSQGSIFLLMKPWGIYRSSDNGNNWTSTNNGLSNTAATTLAVNSLGDVLAGTSNGVYCSTDNGNSWVPLGLTTSYIFSIVINSRGDIFAGTTEGVYYSSDNGSNWHQINGGLTNKQIISLGVDSNGYIFAGTNGSGIFRSVNSTTVPVELTSFSVRVDKNKINLSWTTATELNNSGFEIQRKLSEYDFSTVAFVNGNGTSTKTNNYSWSEKLLPGIYSYRLKQIDYNGKYEYSKEVEITVTPNIFSLEQNFPNPFNPNTVISYSLPSASNVKLVVYNTLGQNVKVLENGYKNAGGYSVHFDASDLPSGIYFYRLEAGQFTQVKKMMLLK